jgi:hypothetical protein
MDWVTGSIPLPATSESFENRVEINALPGIGKEWGKKGLRGSSGSGDAGGEKKRETHFLHQQQHSLHEISEFTIRFWTAFPAVASSRPSLILKRFQ